MPRTLPILKMDSLTSMAHSKTFNICSFNMHSFLNGLSMVKELCHKFDIILLQEHWLLEDNLCKLASIENDFAYCAVSSMTYKASLNILSGRPFGGVAIL